MSGKRAPGGRGARRFPGRAGPPEEHYFINVLSAGLGGLVGPLHSSGFPVSLEAVPATIWPPWDRGQRRSAASTPASLGKTDARGGHPRLPHRRV